LYGDEKDRRTAIQQSSVGRDENASVRVGNWQSVAGYLAFAVLLNIFLASTMIWLFNKRWRISQ
jgi:hypothetical protein